MDARGLPIVSNQPGKYDVLRRDGEIVGIVRRDVGTLKQQEEYGAFQRKIYTSIRATLTQKQMLNPNAGMSYSKIEDIIEAAYRSRPPVA
jgi:hypothetical protein